MLIFYRTRMRWILQIFADKILINFIQREFALSASSEFQPFHYLFTKYCMLNRSSASVQTLSTLNQSFTSALNSFSEYL